MSLAVKQVPQAAPCCATGSHSSSISTRSQFAPKEMAVGGMAAVSGSPPSAWPPSPATYPLDQHLLIFPVAPCLEKGNTMLLRRVERGCADSMAPSSKPGHLKITPAVLFEWETHPTMGQNLRTCPPIAWGVEELPSDRCKASWERCISSCGLGNQGWGRQPQALPTGQGQRVPISHPPALQEPGPPTASTSRPPGSWHPRVCPKRSVRQGARVNGKCKLKANLVNCLQLGADLHTQR